MFLILFVSPIKTDMEPRKLFSAVSKFENVEYTFIVLT